MDKKEKQIWTVVTIIAVLSMLYFFSEVKQYSNDFTSNDFENLSNYNSAKNNVYKTNPDICSMYNDSIHGMVKGIYKEQKKIIK